MSKDLKMYNSVTVPNKYTIIKTMEAGRGFGDTAIIKTWFDTPVRMAYVHTLKPTWFLVIDQTTVKAMLR